MLRFAAVALLFVSGVVNAEKPLFGSGSIDKRQTAASTVVCTKALWTQTNTISGLQGPCQILGALGRQCVSDLSIEPITHAEAPYVLPTGNFNNACLCNVVAYNLIAACSWCQTGIVAGDWVTESQWSGACTNYNPTGISSTVNTAGLVFPQWAFESNAGLAWSAADASAEALLGQPPVTGTVSGNVLPASAVTPTSTKKSTTTTYRSGGGGGGPYINTKAVTNFVAIVVGVILGVYALIIIIILIVYFRRQANRRAWYGPMAAHYRNGGLPPWQSGAGAAAYSEQGSLLSGAAPAPVSHYQPSNQLPYSPSATPFSQTSYSQTPPPVTHYTPPNQHQQFDYGSPQPGGFASQQQYQQPQYHQPQFAGGYTGAAQV